MTLSQKDVSMSNLLTLTLITSIVVPIDVGWTVEGVLWFLL